MPTTSETHEHRRRKRKQKKKQRWQHHPCPPGSTNQPGPPTREEKEIKTTTGPSTTKATTKSTRTPEDQPKGESQKSSTCPKKNSRKRNKQYSDRDSDLPPLRERHQTPWNSSNNFRTRASGLTTKQRAPKEPANSLSQ